MSTIYAKEALRITSQSNPQSVYQSKAPKMKNTNMGKFRIFFKGLKKRTTPDLVYSIFSSFGRVSQLRVPFSKTTQKCMGYGYVVFADKNKGQEVLDSHPSVMIEGKKVDLSRFDFKEKIAYKSHRKNVIQVGFPSDNPGGFLSQEKFKEESDIIEDRDEFVHQKTNKKHAVRSRMTESNTQGSPVDGGYNLKPPIKVNQILHRFLDKPKSICTNKERTSRMERSISKTGHCQPENSSEEKDKRLGKPETLDSASSYIKPTSKHYNHHQNSEVDIAAQLFCPQSDPRYRFNLRKLLRPPQSSHQNPLPVA